MALGSTVEVPQEAAHEVRESVKRLTRDLAKTAETFDKGQARFFVSMYYQMQHNRITAESQIRDSTKNKQSHELTQWYFTQNQILEAQVMRALDKWTDAHFIGRWSKTIVGIGPVIAAGLLANINLEDKIIVKDEATGEEVEKTIIRSTASSIWTYAGIAQIPIGICETCQGFGYVRYAGDDRPRVQRTVYDNSAQRTIYGDKEPDTDPCPECMGAGKLTQSPKWEKGKKRPWNAEMKVLIAYKLGESFVKVQNHKADFYGKVFAERKRLEQDRNDRLIFKKQAEQILKTKKIDKKTDAYKAYEQGKLPPAHIHARARRFAAKLFISHYHFMMYREQFGKEPPAPYPIAHLGHANWITPPNINFEKELKPIA